MKNDLWMIAEVRVWCCGLQLASACWLLDLPFCSEDRDSTFLRNIRLYPNNMALSTPSSLNSMGLSLVELLCIIFILGRCRCFNDHQLICKPFVSFTKNTIYNIIYYLYGTRGGVVIEALCYKPEGRGFESR
jgi:hypothetical protein